MKRILAIITLSLVIYMAQGQEITHTGTVELLSFNGTTALFRVETAAAKKVDVELFAKETVFEQLFYAGVEGINDDAPLVQTKKPLKNFSFLTNFFKGKNAPMSTYIEKTELLGNIQSKSGEFTAKYAVSVKYKFLYKTMEQNKLTTP